MRGLPTFSKSLAASGGPGGPPERMEKRARRWAGVRADWRRSMAWRRNNKNRPCSKTCGIDKILKVENIPRKSYINKKINKGLMDITQKKKIVVTDPTP